MSGIIERIRYIVFVVAFLLLGIQGCSVDLYDSSNNSNKYRGIYKRCNFPEKEWENMSKEHKHDFITEHSKGKAIIIYLTLEDGPLYLRDVNFGFVCGYPTGNALQVIEVTPGENTMWLFPEGGAAAQYYELKFYASQDTITNLGSLTLFSYHKYTYSEREFSNTIETKEYNFSCTKGNYLAPVDSFKLKYPEFYELYKDKIKISHGHLTVEKNYNPNLPNK